MIICCWPLFCWDISDSDLKTLLQEGVNRGYPGIAMVSQSPKGVIHSAAIGYSNLEKHTPLRVDDGFHMASINKTFTAVAVLRLIDQRKLSLTVTLKGQLGDIVARIPYADQITVAQLLDHSSGIYPTNNDDHVERRSRRADR
jgi:D-alanyl-D-alanine carboxypeptidase